MEKTPTFTGGPIDDDTILERLPRQLCNLLRVSNGFIWDYGALHVRGACLAPSWHSLRDAWSGASAFSRLYPTVHEDDIPFGQDCVGDQFLLRQERVFRLWAETGELEELGCDLDRFLATASRAPRDVLRSGPLLQLEASGGRLEPGQLISVYPPFCTVEAADGVSLRAVRAADPIASHAAFAKQIIGVPDGARIEIKITDEDKP